MKTQLKLSLSILGLGAFIIVGFQNCAPGTLNSKSMASETDSFSECDDGLCEVIDQKTVGVVNSENALSSMLHEAGVVSPSAATRTAYATQSSKISETGKADTVTAPMWVALTTLSSEVCNDLIVQERAAAVNDRRFFTNVNFAQGYASLSDSVKDDIVRRMARSFWARNETPQEKILIRSTVNETFSGNQVVDTENAVFFICTTMLSSLKAHTY